KVFIFHVKTKDVGELTALSLGTKEKVNDCTWYCKNVTVKKGTKKYVFPYNNWLSSSKIQARVIGHVFVATRAQTATDRDTKSCQKKKEKCRPTTARPQHRKNTPCAVPSETLGFPRRDDGKVGSAKKENIHLDSSKLNNKSIQSPKITEGNTSPQTRTLVRKSGSSKTKPQGILRTKKGNLLVSSGRTKTSKTSDRVTLIVNKCYITRTSDGTKFQPLHGEKNIVDVTSTNTSSGRDLTVPNKTQCPKYRRASSPGQLCVLCC
ncbi:hypothetical protein PRIEUP_LOCUS315, partial [Pristimantis euphronides]